MAEANTQYPELPLPLGVDTATRAELVTADRALSIRNCHVGSGALVERRPFTRLGRTATVDQGDTPARSHGEVMAILPLGDTLAIATEESRIYAPGASGTAWSEVERNDSPVSFKKALHTGPVQAGQPGSLAYRNPNLAIAGDWACVTWWRRETGDDSGRGNGYALIYNLATGLTLRTEKIVSLIGIGAAGSDGSNPSLVPIALGSRFFVFFIDPATDTLRYDSFEPVVDTEWDGATTLIDVRVVGALGNFDACTNEAKTVGYVAYNAGSGEGVSADLTAKRFTAAGTVLVVSDTVQYAGTGYCPAIGISTASTLVCLAHTNVSGHVYAIGANVNDLSVAANGARILIDATNTTAFKQLSSCTYRITDPTGDSEIKATIVWCNEVDSGDGISGDDRFEYASHLADVALEHLTSASISPHEERGVNLCHRPFRLSGLATTACGAASFVGLRHNHEFEDTYYTYIFSRDATADHDEDAPEDTSVCTPVARYSGLTASYPKIDDESLTSSEQGVCAVAARGGRYYWVGVEQVPYRQLAGAIDGSLETLHIYSLDFSRDKCWNAIQVSGQTLIAGSIPRMISPEVMSGECNIVARGMEGIVPLHSPLPFASITATSGLGFMALGTYSYCQTFEYTDVRGRTHRSAPSPAEEITLSGAETGVDLEIRDVFAPQPGYQHYKIVVWRSEADPPDTNNVTFYRLTERLAPAGFADDINDTLADSSISSNEILYTVSGELPNNPPPPSLALCLWKNRIVALDSETGKLWPSKTILDREWPGFHEGLAVSTDVHTSLPVFLSEDTDNLIVWWTDAIGVSYGEPGSDTGVAGSITQPRLLGQRGIGLKYIKSLVRTPIGHMFMSTQGIYLLDPSMGLTYIGHDVEAYNSHVIVGAYVVTTPNGSQEVRFETQGDDSYGDGYVTLVYDLVKQSWHIHTRGRKPLAAANIAGLAYVATQASGTDAPWDADGLPDTSGVWVEDVSTDLPFTPAADPSGTYTAMLDTAWIAPAGRLGRSRMRQLWLLGYHYSTGGTRSTAVTIRRDYISTDEQLASATVDVFASSTQLVIELPMGRQECMAVRLRISGFQMLLAMRIEVEAEKGALRRNNTMAG